MLHYASHSGELERIGAIIQHTKSCGQDISSLRDHDGRNALHHMLSNYPNAKDVEYLLDAGISINDLDSAGESPLSTLLSSWLQPQVIEILTLMLDGERTSLGRTSLTRQRRGKRDQKPVNNPAKVKTT
ncbi:hypothetical protein SCAR479_09752 [Seiridium cardinale]|uniref:Ankyrin repeat protein n=1 Tax=Seiridium cardinale TaxID=138064 RepID=A0ABR2XIK4_9PEZI